MAPLTLARVYHQAVSLVRHSLPRASTPVRALAIAAALHAPACGPAERSSGGYPYPIITSDSGVPIDQPPKPEDAGVKKESGAVIITPETGPDGASNNEAAVVYLQKDENGNYIIGNDIFATFYGQAKSGDFVVESPNVVLSPIPLSGQDIDKLKKVWVEFSTDSTVMAQMPNDPSINTCFPDLINNLPGDTEASCLQTGFEKFLVCPSDPANRVPLRVTVFQASITDGTDPGKPGTILASINHQISANQMEQDPSAGLVGVHCAPTADAAAPLPPLKLDFSDRTDSSYSITISFGKLHFGVNLKQLPSNLDNFMFEAHLRLRLRGSE